MPGVAWIAKINKPEGVSTRFDYLENTGDGTLRITAAEDLATTVYHLNADLLPVLIKNPLGTKTLNWKPNDVVLASEIDEAGRTTVYTYDDFGNLLETNGTGAIIES